MPPQRRRWRCPICGVEYRIPVAVEDPMACPRCADEPPEALQDGVWVPASDWPGESSQPDSAVKAEPVPAHLEWRPDDLLQDDGSSRESGTLSAPARYAAASAESPSYRPQQRPHGQRPSLCR
jgi:hypothetical protein